MNNYNNHKIPILGKPSGEYIEVSPITFNDLNDIGLLFYDNYMKIMTFYDKDYQMLSLIIKNNKIEDIKHFLNILKVKSYRVNDDFTVDVFQDIDFKMDIDELPFKFDYISGNFDISNCKLKTLKNCPDVISGDFIASFNNIVSLNFGPSEVGGNYDVSQCYLENLIGSPRNIKKDFICNYNNLKNLKGGPVAVKGSYYVDNCLLNSLLGAPPVIGKDFDCSYNYLTDLINGPNQVGGIYNCSHNNINNINYGRPLVYKEFICDGKVKL